MIKLCGAASAIDSVRAVVSLVCIGSHQITNPTPGAEAVVSDAVTLEFLGTTLRAIQAEQRTQRMENDLIRKEIGRLASRDELLEVLRVLADRTGNFEALMEARFDQLDQRIASLPR